jgi:hypothetical protein
MAVRRIRLHSWSWVVTAAFVTVGAACGPRTAAAQNAPSLRYGFQAGRRIKGSGAYTGDAAVNG